MICASSVIICISSTDSRQQKLKRGIMTHSKQQFSATRLLKLCVLFWAVGSAAQTSCRAAPPAALVLPDINAKPVAALAPAQGVTAHVFFFLAQDCPLCGQYVPEINRVCSDYGAQGIAFSVVYVDPGLTPKQARPQYLRSGFSCSGLVDARHRLVNRLGATVTPQVAVVGPDGRLLYRGRIDNRMLNWGVSHAPNVDDLRDALDAVLQNHPVPQPWHRAIGCSIPSLSASAASVSTAPAAVSTRP